MLDFEDLQARREARQRSRMLRRRRRLAVGVLALAALVTGLVVGAGAGSQPSTAARTANTARTDSTKRTTHRTTRHHHHTPPPRTVQLVPGQGRDAAAPILMYHVINPPPPGAPFPALYVTRQEFAKQMQALYEAGWTAVTMDQLWDAWTKGIKLPPGHPIVITFDNGYRSQAANALPVLRHLGWKGVENIQLTGLPKSQGGLTHAAVHRLLASGWELDTQGISHADLVALGPAELEHEVADARRTLQRRWHKPIHWFCYPSGHYDAKVIAVVRAAGYIGSTTVVPGWARRTDDPYRLPRLRVVGGTSPHALLEQIAAARNEPPAPATYGL